MGTNVGTNPHVMSPSSSPDRDAIVYHTPSESGERFDRHVCGELSKLGCHDLGSLMLNGISEMTNLGVAPWLVAASEQVNAAATGRILAAKLVRFKLIKFNTVSDFEAKPARSNRFGVTLGDETPHFESIWPQSETQNESIADVVRVNSVFLTPPWIVPMKCRARVRPSQLCAAPPGPCDRLSKVVVVVLSISQHPRIVSARLSTALFVASSVQPIFFFCFLHTNIQHERSFCRQRRSSPPY